MSAELSPMERKGGAALIRRTTGISGELRLESNRASRTLFLLWLLLMVLIPHSLRIGGIHTVVVFVSLSVALQASLVLSLLFTAMPGFTTIGIGAAIVAAAWLIEVIGVQTGLLFGTYAYTGVLRPQLASIPVQVPVAWLMMLPPSWAVGAIIVHGGGMVGRSRSWKNDIEVSLVAGLAFTAWDLFLDPQMVAWGFWQWQDSGNYFGIPLANYVGWTLAASAITFASTRLGVIDRLPFVSLAVVYTTTWLLESVGLGFFFGLPGPAAAGFLGMGIFAALAWRKLLEKT